MSALDLLSDWSSFTRISISGKQWQEGNTGRYYYRHPTEPGTVIGWHDIGTNADVERHYPSSSFIFCKESIQWTL